MYNYLKIKLVINILQISQSLSGDDHYLWGFPCWRTFNDLNQKYILLKFEMRQVLEDIDLPGKIYVW